MDAGGQPVVDQQHGPAGPLRQRRSQRSVTVEVPRDPAAAVKVDKSAGLVAFRCHDPLGGERGAGRCRNRHACQRLARPDVSVLPHKLAQAPDRVEVTLARRAARQVRQRALEVGTVRRRGRRQTALSVQKLRLAPTPKLRGGIRLTMRTDPSSGDTIAMLPMTFSSVILWTKA